ncbi:T9SS type A sorting domain-containing protein [bacterium]|nr:T9SS type A sorting domain-containing protein [bacterium]
MKKIYILAIAAFAFTLNMNAQVEQEIDMEDYEVGDNISAQDDFNWQNWSGDNTNDDEAADVTNSFSLSGSNSMSLTEINIDQLLLIDSAPTSGVYSVQWSMYIPDGKEGYFNMQAVVVGNPQEQSLQGGNVYFNEENTTPGEGTVDGGADVVTFEFPHDAWFTLTAVYDIDNTTWDMYINGSQVVTAKPFEFNGVTVASLGAIDFFAPSGLTEYYVDDVVVFNGDLILAAEDFNAAVFSVYPNPVVNTLNIQTADAVQNVTVYDVLGKVVMNVNPGVVSPSLDMSSLNAGVYLVNVTINGTSKSVKVIK